jgi:hypothetical protein
MLIGITAVAAFVLVGLAIMANRRVARQANRDADTQPIRRSGWFT